MSEERLPNLLIVDDETVICQSIKRYFVATTTKYSVQACDRPVEAAELIRSGVVDILITDLMMPDVDGVDLIRLCRQKSPHIPIIALTAHKDISAEIRCLEAGATYFMEKPYDCEALLTAVNILYDRMSFHKHNFNLLDAVSERKDHLQAIIDNTTDSVFVADLEGRLLLANKATQELVGEASLGQLPEGFLSEQDVLRLRGHIKTVLDSGRLHEFDLPFMKAGVEHFYSLKMFPLFDESQKPWAICGISRDVTERKRMEEQMSLLALFPEVNPDVVLRVDLTGNVTFMNPAANAWLRENSLPESGIYYLLPDDFLALLNRAVKNRETIERDVEYNGKTFAFKLTPFTDLAACMISLTDISERVRLLREREIYMQAFLNSVHGVLITDVQGKILHINQAFETMYGYSMEKVRGRNPRILNPGRAAYHDLGYSDEEYDAIFSDLWAKITDPACGHWEGDIPNLQKGGHIIWVHLFISAIRDPEGNIIAFVGMPMDITARRKQEQEIRLECYRAITELAETRDNETGAHLSRISLYSVLLSKQLGMSSKFIEDIKVFAPLHDIGKVGIPDSILLAPRKLTQEEFTVMKTHASLGRDILEERATLEMAAEIAGGHHERWDGTGYPEGVAEDEIPLAARIVAVADVYDALRSERPYKKAWEHEDASNVIREGAGTHFDPRVVDAFFAIENQVREASHRLKDDDATMKETS